MNEANRNNDAPVNDELAGIPGVGPVRRRLLLEAGITTRVSLAAASVEQLVSVTGMPRSAAEQVLEQVKATALLLPPAPVVETAVEASPDALGEEPLQASRLERAVLRAQTAIADASRHAAPKSRLEQMLPRFAQLLESLPVRITAATRPAVQRRLAERVEAITERLEGMAEKASGTKAKPAPLSAKRARRLQQRLKRTRDSIKKTLKNARVSKSAAPGTKVASSG